MQVEWPVTFYQLPYEEVGQLVSYRPQDLIKPVLDTLEDWDAHTEVHKRKWADFDIASDGERVTIDGHPLHPYTQRRLVRFLLGVSATHKEVWDVRPDLLAELIKSAPPLAGAEQVQVRVTHGQVVYATNLHHELGSHFDYFSTMADMLGSAHHKNRTPMAVLGYLVDPVWVHVRLVYLPKGAQSFLMGPQLDAGYLFSQVTRGRASLALCAHSLKFDASITMDNWWSVRTPTLQPHTNDALLETFRKRSVHHVKKIREKATAHTRSLTHLNRAKPKSAWRQFMVGDVGRLYLGRAAMRQAAIDFDRRGGGGRVDFAFAMAKAMETMQFERRIQGERELAYHLKALRK